MPLTCVCDAVQPSSQQMKGGIAADPMGRKVASRWQCHNATSVVDLCSGLIVPRILYKAVVASVPAAARGGANDVLPRVCFC